VINFAGERQWRMFVKRTFPGGALEIKSVVSDLSAEFDVQKIVGKREVSVRLVKDLRQGESDPNLNAALGASHEGKELLHTVLFDSTPPVGVKIVDIASGNGPQRDQILVTALGNDPESGIAEVLFYLGKPVDGKAPVDAEVIRGRREEKLLPLRLDVKPF